MKLRVLTQWHAAPGGNLRPAHDPLPIGVLYRMEYPRVSLKASRDNRGHDMGTGQAPIDPVSLAYVCAPTPRGSIHVQIIAPGPRRGPADIPPARHRRGCNVGTSDPRISDQATAHAGPALPNCAFL